MSDKGLVKMSVNLSEEVVDALRKLSEKRGTTMTEVLRQAIGTEKYLDEVQSPPLRSLRSRKGRKQMTLKRNSKDDQSRQYWEFVDRAAQEVRSWPDWKKGGPTQNASTEEPELSALSGEVDGCDQKIDR